MGLALGLVAGGLGAGPAIADEEADVPLRQQILDGLRSSFALPLGDLLVKRHESEWRNLLDGFSATIGLSYPLNDEFVGPAVGGDRRVQQTVSSPTLNLGLRYNPIGNWFVATTLYRYLDKDEQQPWNPDFSYSFGYEDWRPYTLSLVYANYGGNRFSPNSDDDEQFTRFSQGTWSLGWRFPLPRLLAEPMLIERTAQIDCQTAVNLTPSYYDLDADANRDWKTTLSLACHYPIYAGWALNWRAFYYTDGDSQQPWDPDFTYGVSYAPVWLPGLSVRYDNYSGNRFFWRDRADNTGRFADGAVSVNWSWQW